MYISSKQEETIGGVYLGKDVSILDEQIPQTAEAMPVRHLVYEITWWFWSAAVSKSCTNTGNLIIAQNSIAQATLPFPAAWPQG